MLYDNDWKTCIVCDRRGYARPLQSWYKSPFHTVSIRDLPEKVWTVLTHQSSNLHPDLISMYDISSHKVFESPDVPNPITNDERVKMRSVMLSPRGVSTNGKVSVCRPCWNHLVKKEGPRKQTSDNSPPRFSIRDGFFIGQLPIKLRLRPMETLYEQSTTRTFIPGSSLGEISLVQPIHQSRSARVLVLRGKEHESQHGLRGHLQSFKLDVQADVIDRYFPCRLDDAPVKVLLTGPCTETEFDRARRVVQIRKQQVSDLIDKYHSWKNPFCRDWKKNVTYLDELPVNDTPDQLFSWNEKTKGDFGPESSNTTVLDEDDTDGFGFCSTTNIHPVRVTVGDFIEKMQQNQQNSTFDTIHSTASSEPDWDLEYLPRAFVHLFPFGRGGPDENRHHKYSLVSILNHYLRISTGQFMGPEFVLSIYNIMARKQAQENASLVARRRTQGRTLAEQWAALTEDELSMCSRYQEECARSRMKHRRQPDPPTMDPRAFRLGDEFWKSMKSSSGKMPHTHEAAGEARLCCFSYIYKFGKPTLMITVNPDDTTSILITFLTGRDTDDCPELRISKTLMSQYPGISGISFEHVMNVFINVIIGWDTQANKALKKGGLFGIPKAFFGPAEEQARLSLHSHLLVWISTHDVLVERLTTYDPISGKYVINQQEQQNLEMYIARVVQSSLPRDPAWSSPLLHNIQQKCESDANNCLICNTELVPTEKFDSCRKHTFRKQDPAILMCPSCPNADNVAPKRALTEAIESAWATLGLEGPPPTSSQSLRTYKWRGLGRTSTMDEKKGDTKETDLQHPLEDPRTSLLILGLCKQCNGMHKHMTTCSKSRVAQQTGYCRSGLCARPVASTKVSITLPDLSVTPSLSLSLSLSFFVSLSLCLSISGRRKHAESAIQHPEHVSVC